MHTIGPHRLHITCLTVDECWPSDLYANVPNLAKGQRPAAGLIGRKDDLRPVASRNAPLEETWNPTGYLPSTILECTHLSNVAKC